MADLRDTLNLFVRRFALALHRSTRLQPGGGPPGAPETPDDELVRGSTRHLPGAGWLVGLLGALVFAVLALLLRGNPLGPLLAAVASVFATIVLTGGRPESAVFRTGEAMESRPPAARPGTGFGAIALVLLLTGRIAALAALGAMSEGGVLSALFAAPVISRFAPLLAAYWRDQGPHVDGWSVQVAGLWCVVPLLLMLLADGGVFLLLALVAAAIAWVAVLRFFRKHPAPFRQDRAASLQQACELAFYLGAAIGA